MQYLANIDLTNYKSKICLLRVDLNIAEGTEKHSYRLESIIPTISTLVSQGIKTVVVSHRGRYDDENPAPSMSPFMNILSERLNEPVHFINHFDFQKGREEVAESDNHRLFLMENLRRVPEEQKNSEKFGKGLASMADFFVQDGFAVAHRKNASVTQVPKFLPSFGGLLLEKEIKNLNKVMESYESPLTVILGGAKTRSKIGVIKNFWDKAENFLLGGGPANTFLVAKGKDIGDSLYDKKSIEQIKKYIKSNKIKLPSDFQKKDDRILDIGQNTAKEYSSIIQESKTIIWNGPLGLIEQNQFSKGTGSIAKAIAESDGFSAVGGGETTEFLMSKGLLNQFNFVSTGGGAMLAYLAGKELPGITALEHNIE